jgi:hypothetical protein
LIKHNISLIIIIWVTENPFVLQHILNVLNVAEAEALEVPPREAAVTEVQAEALEVPPREAAVTEVPQGKVEAEEAIEEVAAVARIEAEVTTDPNVAGAPDVEVREEMV